MAIERVFVAGAGLMGHGIAQVHAAIGKHVVLYEPDLARAQAGRERIAGNLERAVAKGKLDADERDAIARPDRRVGRPRPASGRRISSSRPSSRTSRSSASSGAQLDERAPAERDLRLEHELDLDRRAGRGRRRRRARAGSSGMHFFSPVPVMPLVELIRGSATTDDDRERDPRADRTSSASRSSSRPTGPGSSSTASSCRSSPRRCARSRRARGTAEDIDTGREGRAEPPDGPARARRLHRPRRLPRHHAGPARGLGEEHFPPPKVLVDLVEAGHLGQKTGRGFHTYPRA